MKSVSQRFNEKVQVCEQSGCHLWVGATDGGGFGVIQIGDKLVKAHRYAYGAVPAGHEVAQKCGDRACVNPDHLEARPRHTGLKQAAAARKAQRERAHQGAIDSTIYRLRRGLMDLDEAAPFLVTLKSAERRAVEIAVADSVDVHALRGELKRAATALKRTVEEKAMA